MSIETEVAKDGAVSIERDDPTFQEEIDISSFLVVKRGRKQLLTVHEHLGRDVKHEG